MTQLYDQDAGLSADVKARGDLVTYRKALSSYQWALAKAGQELAFCLTDIDANFGVVGEHTWARYVGEVRAAHRAYDWTRSDAWRTFRAAVPSERGLTDEEDADA